MTNRNIIKYSIVIVLLLLLAISLFFLIRQLVSSCEDRSSKEMSFTILSQDSIALHNETINSSCVLNGKLKIDTINVAEIYTIIKNNTCSADSIIKFIADKIKLDSTIKTSFVAQDSIVKQIEDMIKLGTVLDDKLEPDTIKVSEIDSIIKNTMCSADSIKKLIVEKAKLDSIIKVISLNQDSIRSSLDELKQEYSNLLLQQNNQPISNNEKIVFSTKTLILIVISVILVIALLVSFILFSGILKIFNKNKNMEDINNSKPRSEEFDSVSNPSTDVKEFESSKQKLSHEISPDTDSNEKTDDRDFSQDVEKNTNPQGDDSGIIPKKDPQKESLVESVSDNRVRVFTTINNVIGISYQGDNHIKAMPPVPCQDCHLFTKVNDIWNIAIVSDGAGSKEHSDIGSNAVCAAFKFYLSNMLKNDKRFERGDIPNEKIWDLEFRALLTRFQTELKTHKAFKSYDFGSYAATIIILVYSSKGYMFAHVGDGRAGVKINGKWQSILTPHKGEEANQTIFSTTIEFINKPTLMMSGVFVPETKVGEGTLEAFVLMSDGCEDGAWTTYQKVNLPNGDFKVEDVNQPRAQTLDELLAILDSESDNFKSKLIDFITGYNKGFKTEGDDKTIIIGRNK